MNPLFIQSHAPLMASPPLVPPPPPPGTTQSPAAAASLAPLAAATLRDIQAAGADAVSMVSIHNISGLNSADAILADTVRQLVDGEGKPIQASAGSIHQFKQLAARALPSSKTMKTALDKFHSDTERFFEGHRRNPRLNPLVKDLEGIYTNWANNTGKVIVCLIHPPAHVKSSENGAFFVKYLDRYQVAPIGGQASTATITSHAQPGSQEPTPGILLLQGLNFSDAPCSDSTSSMAFDFFHELQHAADYDLLDQYVAQNYARHTKGESTDALFKTMCRIGADGRITVDEGFFYIFLEGRAYNIQSDLNPEFAQRDAYRLHHRRSVIHDLSLKPAAKAKIKILNITVTNIFERANEWAHQMQRFIR